MIYLLLILVYYFPFSIFLERDRDYVTEHLKLLWCFFQKREERSVILKWRGFKNLRRILERKIEIGEKNLKTNSFLFSDIFVV